MASLKYFRKRINVLRNMQKVMHAMRMIASIKMHKLLRYQASLTMFEQSLENIGRDIGSALAHLSDPLVVGYQQVKKAHVIIFTADKGMCGAHNSSIYRELDLFMLQCAAKRKVAEVSCIGNRGVGYCNRKEYGIFYQSEINERTVDEEFIHQLAATMMDRFLDNDIQELYLISNYYVSAIHQTAITTQLIPFVIPTDENNKKIVHEVLLEQAPERFIVEAGTMFIFYKLLSALYNSYLSEHASRMTAMENATANSEELIKHYVKLRNRARQSSITNALMEIISGKEALKG